MASTPGFEPGPHWWEASALITKQSCQKDLSSRRIRESAGRSVHRHGAWGVGIIIVLYLWARYKFLKELPAVLMS